MNREPLFFASQQPLDNSTPSSHSIVSRLAENPGGASDVEQAPEFLYFFRMFITFLRSQSLRLVLQIFNVLNATYCSNNSFGGEQYICHS